MSSGARALSFLLSRGLLSAEEVVNGQVDCVAITRRNDNVRVNRSTGVSYLVKRGRGERGLGTLAHEARVLDRLTIAGAGANGVRVPRLVLYDRREDTLVLEMAVPARNLREASFEDGPPGPAMGAQLAVATKALHELTGVLQAGDDWSLPTDPPAVMSLHRPTLDLVRTLSTGNRRLVTTIQSFPRLCTQLDELRARWRPTALLHGDLRWDNCVVAGSGDLLLVDWEFARAGDPLWDVGCVLADYVASWVRSTPTGPGGASQFLADAAACPLSLWPSTSAFWRTYGPGGRASGLVAQYVAARLMEYACEELHRSSEITETARMFAQLAANMLEKPGAAATDLLGLPRVVMS